MVNRAAHNGVGEAVGYRLIPGSTPTLLARPEASVAKRAAFTTENLWVTPFAPNERRAAGDFINQHPGGDGLPAWTAADRSLVIFSSDTVADGTVIKKNTKGGNVVYTSFHNIAQTGDDVAQILKFIVLHL